MLVLVRPNAVTEEIGGSAELISFHLLHIKAGDTKTSLREEKLNMCGAMLWVASCGLLVSYGKKGTKVWTKANY